MPKDLEHYLISIGIDVLFIWPMMVWLLSTGAFIPYCVFMFFSSVCLIMFGFWIGQVMFAEPEVWIPCTISRYNIISTIGEAIVFFCWGYIFFGITKLIGLIAAYYMSRKRLPEGAEDACQKVAFMYNFTIKKR